MKIDLDHAMKHVKCTQCGTEIVRIRNIFDPQTGRTVRLMECRNGHLTWDEK